MSESETTVDVEVAGPAVRMAARRWNRARRAGLIAVLGITVALWFSENYLRYDLHESQYIVSLSLAPESARAILRNVVKKQTEKLGQPTPVYLEALASIEEDDLVLTRYQEAYALNPNSWELVLNYGTRQFLAGRPAEARERFREAGVQDPENALPKYLEAAALTLSEQQVSDLSEALSIIARTNVSQGPVRFPEPLWHVSLPRRGELYMKKQEDIVDRSCAPFYKFKNLIESRARAEGADDPYQWDDWLETVQTMGLRLMERHGEDAPVSYAQAVAGLQIQMDMLRTRAWLAQSTGRNLAEGSEARMALLRKALDQLNQMNDARKQRVDAVRNQLRQPLWNIANAASLLLLLVLGMAGLVRVTGLRRVGLDFVVPSRALILPFVLLVVFVCVLCVQSVAAWQGVAASVGALLTLAWYLVLLVGIVLGLLLPIRYLSRQPGYQRKDPDAQRVQDRGRLGGYFILSQRTWEDVLSALLAATCLWIVGGRIVLGLYPFELTLLAPAFEADALKALESVAVLMSSQ